MMRRYANIVPGTYKLSRKGFQTFVPHPLPPDLPLPAFLHDQVEDTMHVLGQVEMCRSLLPNPDLLVYGSIQREALASTTIELGPILPEDLLRFQASRASHRELDEAVRQVANYQHALEWGVQQMAAHPLSTSLMLGLHERLMDGVRGAYDAGRFKEHQNAIFLKRGGSAQEGYASTPGVGNEAAFIPPAPEDVSGLIADLERYIHSRNSEPKLVQCALVHYQFESIHPFRDGNGRVGRLLIMLQIIQLGLLSAPLIFPSGYFERTYDEYAGRLQDVRERGAWHQWLEYFLHGVEEQCREAITFTHTVLKLRTRLHEEVPHVRRRASLIAVLDAFFRHPVLSVHEVSRGANVALNTARTAIEELESLDMVREVTGKGKGRTYACEPLMQAIFERHGVERTLAER